MFCLLHAHNRQADCIGHAVWGNMKALGLLAGLKSPAVHWDKQLCIPATWHGTSFQIEGQSCWPLRKFRKIPGCAFHLLSWGNHQSSMWRLHTWFNLWKNTLTLLFMHFLNNWLAFAIWEDKHMGSDNCFDSKVKSPVSQSTFKCLGLSFCLCCSGI